jgi:outer membrane protein OmpA-like peptidoglycan-associated protein
MKKITSFLLIILITFSVYSQPVKKGIFDPASVKLTTLSVNTSHSDFGPTVIGDSLFFTSFRDEFQNKSDKDLQKKEFYNLFSSPIDIEGNVKGNRHVINDFLTRFHDGPTSWCAATGELFITQSNYLEPGAKFQPLRKNYFNLRIMVAKRINGNWKMTGSLPFNSPKYSVGHPAISSAGDTLIFTSDKPGGLGETDLYMSLRKNGQWSDPVNLGNKINTAGKDEFPCLTNNGYLIFASTGRQGMGGLDLYYTKLNDPKHEIVHFDSPINSSNDDFSMILPPNVEYGYLTSDRTGGSGSDDIYKISFERYKDNLLKLLVMDTKSKRPIPGANVAFDDKMKFKTEKDGEISRNIVSEMAYNVNVNAFGYTDGSKMIKTGILKNGITVHDTVWMNMIVKKSVVMKNIYYDYDKWDILPESGAELDRLTAFMIENPEVKIELSSHTDSRGSVAYNQKLSERRAKSALDYILSKGIGIDRITSKGYGESMPVNKCVDNVKCTPQELRMNRRTEFYIPEFGKSQNVDQEGKGDYTTGSVEQSRSKEASSLKQKSKYPVIVGSFTDLPNANKIKDLLKDDGYQAEIITDSKLFKVGVGFKDLKSAQDGLSKLKTKYPGAWINK